MIMKKTLLYLFIIPALALQSCDSLFEPKTIGDVSDEAMWVVPDLARGVLMQAYNNMPNRPDNFSQNFLDAATDNAVTNGFSSEIYQLALGGISSTNSRISCWSTAYEQFQHIHLFLEKGLTANTRYAISTEEDDVEAKRQLRAEAMYLRAWWGAYLLQFHGGRTTDGQALGYPIVKEYITEEKAKDFSWIKRNTYEECVQQICADCDEAAAVLPLTATGAYIGRATATMAEFLKARVLFYAACPAYQPASIVQINGMGSYTVVDEAAWKEKWERAARQAWKVLELCGTPAYVATKRTDLVDIDQNNPVTPSHFIFRYYYQANGLESRQYPPYYFGACGNMPSQNLVDAFPMKANGYPIDAAGSGYDPANPYEGRDNRLDFTVYHQGSKFGQNESYIDIVEGGKDAPSFMSGGNRGTRTGYYLHKWLSEKENMLDPVQSVTALHFYPTMRLAEIFLSLAEASNEVWGPEGKGDGIGMSAYEIIKDIRKKSGGIVEDLYIDAVKGSKDDFLKLILNERRLEMAFENVRFWDLRRRLLPLDEPIRGIVATRAADGTLSYSIQEVEKRGFNQLRHYYLPIPYAEVQKNPLMVNNMDY